MNTPQLKLLAALSAVLVAAVVVVPAVVQDARATHQPADKVVAHGSNVEVFGPGVDVTLLAGTMRTSNPTDLLLSVSLECSILTEVTTVGNDNQEAFGRIEVWVEIDGVPVGVTETDDGRVVFCDRVHQQETTLFDDEDATIRSYLASRTANAFNWARLNLGSGIHTIAVKGTLTEAATANAVAEAAIGKRTFIAEPTKLANDAVI